MTHPKTKGKTQIMPQANTLGSKVSFPKLPWGVLLLIGLKLPEKNLVFFHLMQIQLGGRRTYFYCVTLFLHVVLLFVHFGSSFWKAASGYFSIRSALEVLTTEILGFICDEKSSLVTKVFLKFELCASNIIIVDETDEIHQNVNYLVFHHLPHLSKPAMYACCIFPQTCLYTIPSFTIHH